MASSTALPTSAEHAATALSPPSSPLSPPPDPPSYSTAMSMTAEGNYGFPPGYFVIRSVATERLLDVEQDNVGDGAEIILWPEKETSLVEGESLASSGGDWS